MSRAFTRRQVLAAAAGAMLGFGACQKQETASDKPELVLRYAENQPEDYPTTQAALAFGNLLMVEAFASTLRRAFSVSSSPSVRAASSISCT